MPRKKSEITKLTNLSRLVKQKGSKKLLEGILLSLSDQGKNDFVRILQYCCVKFPERSISGSH